MLVTDYNPLIKQETINPTICKQMKENLEEKRNLHSFKVTLHTQKILKKKNSVKFAVKKQH